MNYQESINKYGLVPDDSALLAIRQLLAQQAELERSGQEREEDLALLCCVQLFSRGHLEDVLLLWDAKQSGFDLACSLDVQFLCGAGLGPTKQFLSTHPSEEAALALKYIRECELSGDFDAWSPASHMQYYERYFGIK